MANVSHNDALLRQRIMQFYNDTRAFEQMVGVIIPTIFSIVIVIGVLGNALVILVALNRQMRNSTNTLIIGLTISDLMFLTLCVPFTAIDYAYPVWVLPTWTCNMINYLQHASAYFSVWTLTLMAADRFLAVCYPVESMTLRNPANTCIALIIVYTIILLSQIQVGKIHDVYNYTFVIENRSACSIVSIAKGEATVTEARIYFFSFNIFGYLLPLGITCILYYLMLKRLWYTPRPGNGSNNKAMTGSVRSRPETIRAKRKQIVTESSSLLLKSPMGASSNGITDTVSDSTPSSINKLNHRPTSSLVGRLRRNPREHRIAQRTRTCDEISST
uniref:G_PROTEIN_RECEP_F1_2 domain-containing protein n=1 Tax=Panagrellus redivivus TaxID=6233 RepID=A0A7E4VH72_PANRE